MMPPFAVSFSSNRLTRTRSCRGVTFMVISLTSVLSERKISIVTSGPKPTLRMKSFYILLSHHFQVVGFFFLPNDFLLRSLFILQLHRFDNGSLRLCIQLFCRYGEPETGQVAGTKEAYRVLRILPSSNYPVCRAIPTCNGVHGNPLGCLAQVGFESLLCFVVSPSTEK